MGKYLKHSALAATLVLWASAFVGIRAGLKEYSPFHLALLRYGTASLVLFGVVLFKKIRIPAREDVWKLFLTGFIGIGAYNIALNCGERTVTASSASFIVGTVPILTAILSVFLLREQMNFIGWIGMAISFAGVSLISVGEGGGLTFEKGILLIALAAVCQCIYIIAQKPLLKKYSSFEVTAYSIWSGTVLLLLFSKGLYAAMLNASYQATAAAIYMGVFPGVIAYFCWAFVLSKFSASKASSFLFLVPIITIAIGFLWLHEVPKGVALIGGLLVISGVVLANKSSFLHTMITGLRQEGF